MLDEKSQSFSSADKREAKEPASASTSDGILPTKTGESKPALRSSMLVDAVLSLSAVREAINTSNKKLVCGEVTVADHKNQVGYELARLGQYSMLNVVAKVVANVVIAAILVITLGQSSDFFKELVRKNNDVNRKGTSSCFYSLFPERREQLARFAAMEIGTDLSFSRR